MTLGIEIAPPTVSVPRRTQAGAISLSGSSTLPGFASLFNGLLDPDTKRILRTPAGRQENATRDALLSLRLRSQSVPSERTAGESGIAGSSTKHKSGAATHPDGTLPFLLALGQPTSSPPLPRPGEKDITSTATGGARTVPLSTPSLSPQVAPPALPPASSASLRSGEISWPNSAAENATTTGNLAFALQLSWRPPLLRPGAAPPSVSGATAAGSMADFPGTLGDAADGRVRLTAAANVLTPSYAGGQQRQRGFPLAEVPLGGASEFAQSRRSGDASVLDRDQLGSQARGGAFLERFSSTRASSPLETAGPAILSPQSAGSTTTLDAAWANSPGEVQSEWAEANRFPGRVPENTSAGSGDRTREQDPAEPESLAPPDRSTPSTSAVALGWDKQPSGPPRSPSGNTQATPPVSGPSAGESESEAAGDAGIKPGAKSLGNLPAQKLAPPPGNHESPGTPADGALPVRSANPTETPTGRTPTGGPENPETRPAGRTEAAPVLPSPSIREVSIRLGAATSTPVDVQLTAKAGKVQVAVRTPDLDLAKTLQTNLGELVGRLEEKGFKTAAWTPQATTHAGLAVRQPATSTADQGHSDHSGSPGGQPDARGGQRQSGHRQQGRWEAEFQETLSAPDATPQAGD